MSQTETSVETDESESDSTFRFGGKRSIRPNGESTSIVTLARQTLELAQLETDERVALHAREGEIRVDGWDRGSPSLPHRLDRPWYDGGLRKVRPNGSSSVVTLTDPALDVSGHDSRDALYQYAAPGAVVLVPAIDDRPAAPQTLAEYEALTTDEGE